VARERSLEPARVGTLIEEHTEGRFLGVLGEPRVNVLALNLALDRAAAQ
jgi:K+-transporting ATPase ATPase C chain